MMAAAAGRAWEVDLGRTLFKGDDADDTGAPTGAGGPVFGKPLVAKDFAVLAALPLSMLVAWTVPEALWQRIARLTAPIAARLLKGRAEATVERIERLVGDRPLPIPPAQVAQELAAGHVEEYLQVLREYRPLGWRPPTVLEGKQHVEAALERGRGAVLWISHFTFAPLLGKKASHAAGLRLSHLSHPSHGFSHSRFGMRFLNPVRITVEDRYLHERVVLAVIGSTAAMRELHRRLRDNRVVSIAVRERAQRPSIVPFLDGTIKLASGAVDLAYLAKAALLPVFTVREPGRGYRVVIEPPLDIRHDLPRHDAADLALRAYAERLAPYVLAYPGQWRGWLHV